MTAIDDEQVRIFIVFGDIRGFGTWLRRTNSAEEYRPFFQAFEDELDEFESKFHYAIKRNGDGFMAVKDMKPGHNCWCTVTMLSDFLGLAERINTIIRQTPYPRPEGFRVRVVAGHAIKKLIKGTGAFRTSDKCRTCPHGKGLDYLGYLPDLCYRLLSVKKDEMLIIHESVLELMNSNQLKQAGLVAKRISPPPDEPDGVDRNDMNLLWAVKRKHNERLLHTRATKKR